MDLGVAQFFGIVFASSVLLFADNYLSLDWFLSEITSLLYWPSGIELQMDCMRESAADFLFPILL